MAGSKGLSLKLQGDVAVQKNSEFLSYVSSLRLRDEFPQDEVSLIISESALKTPAKTRERNTILG